MKLEYIREFIALAETLSFTKAAEKRFLAQPALSRHIAIIEKKMGGRLFKRDTRNVNLTPAGEVVYDAFKEILRQYDSAKENVALLSSGQSGTLSISSPYYWTSDYTEPVVQRFEERFSQCSVRIISCQPPEGVENVANGKSDLLLGFSIPEYKWQISDDLKRFDFALERLSVMMTVEHRYAGLETIKPELLDKESLVFMEEEIYIPMREMTLKRLADHGAYASARI